MTTLNTTLNVSHDLRSQTPPCSFAQNIKPGNPGFDVTNLFNDAITCAINKGYTKITGESGEYYFHTPSAANPACYVNLNGVSNLEIDFPGSTFIFRQPGISGFAIQGCTDCAIKGLAIDYELLPFTQLIVQRIDGDYVVVEPMAGYPNVFQLEKVHSAYATEYVCFDIRARNMQPDIQYAIGGTQLMMSYVGQTNRIYFGSFAAALFQPDDLLIVTARGGNPAINATSSHKLTIKDVTVYTSGGDGIDVDSSNDVTIEQVTIEPKPGTSREVSVVAGGIALNDLKWNNTVRQCTITRACDDSISGHVRPSDYPIKDLNLIIVGNRITSSLLARGIGFTSVTGVHITQNTIIGTQQAGIMLGGATYELEPQPVTDAQITHNTLTFTNIGPAGVGKDMLGAIEVMYYDEKGQAVNTSLNQRIYVNNNTITTTLRSGIWIGNVTEGAVKDNTIFGWGVCSDLPNRGLGNDYHLNNGLEPCACTLFLQSTVGWYNTQFVGVDAASSDCLGCGPCLDC